MTAQSPIAKEKRPLWQRLIKWTLRLAIVLLVLGIAGYAIASYWAARTIHNELARIRAAGEPITFAQLDALAPKVDRAQDAGLYYAAAAELVDSEWETNNDAYYAVLYGKDPVKVSPEVLAWAQHGLEQNRIPLKLIDQGSALSGCNADMQLQYGIAVALPHMGKMRRLMNVVSLRSRVLAAEGKGDAAVESVISSLGLMRAMDREPVIVDAMVDLAMLARACGDACFVLEHAHLSDSALGKLYELMGHLRLLQPRQIYLAERVYYLEVSRNLIANGRMDFDDADAPPIPEGAAWSSLGLTGRIMVARSLPDFARTIDACSDDWPGILARAQSAAEKPTSAWSSSGVNGRAFLQQMFLYGLNLSVLRSTLIAIQVERFRLAHGGQLPDSLAQLSGVSSLPRDPFTGNDLLYVKTPDGYCIFSAGRGHPEDDVRRVDRDKDPVTWSERWGIHIRVASQ